MYCKEAARSVCRNTSPAFGGLPLGRKIAAADGQARWSASCRLRLAGIGRVAARLQNVETSARGEVMARRDGVLGDGDGRPMRFCLGHGDHAFRAVLSMHHTSA